MVRYEPVWSDFDRTGPEPRRGPCLHHGGSAFPTATPSPAAAHLWWQSRRRRPMAGPWTGARGRLPEAGPPCGSSLPAVLRASSGRPPRPCIIGVCARRSARRKQWPSFITQSSSCTSWPASPCQVVLLQQGKSQDLASAFGGGGTDTAIGPRGSANVLSRATTILAGVFMVTSLSLSILRPRSSTILDSVQTPAASPAPGGSAAPATTLPGQSSAAPAGTASAPAPAAPLSSGPGARPRPPPLARGPTRGHCRRAGPRSL